MRAIIVALCVAASTSAVVMSAQSPPPGKAPFDRVCATCHGDEGRGDSAPRLVPIDMGYDEFVARVRGGGGEMPPVSKESMSDEAVKQVLDYLKALSAKENAAR
jgi:mono/diheme cytochrome c family protein